MKLDTKIAQSIVNKMMGQIPYNINMMDENGYIIASGNPKRINTLHLGALDAIKQKKALPMAHSYGEHGQPGINMPVIHHHQIIGVIGITGDPEKVTPLATLLKTATELLISQSELNKISQDNETRLNRFLYQWVQVTNNIQANTNLLLEAEQLDIDVTLKRTAIAIHSAKYASIPVDPTDFLISFSSTITIVLATQTESIKRIIHYCHQHQLALGIGENTITIGNSANHAMRVIQLSRLFNRPDFMTYNQVSFIDKLLKSNISTANLTKIFVELATSDSGQELIDTLIEYIRNNGNMLHTSQILHIHRNTLSYRITQINKKFNLNPHNFLDMLELYVGYLNFMKGLDQK